MAHIAHLSEETMLWSDMATELEAILVEAGKSWTDEAGLTRELDELFREIERKDVMIRWRDRQVRLRDATIATLSQELREARSAYETVKSAHDGCDQERKKLNQERERLDKRIANATSENQRVQNTVRDLELDLEETNADLERVQRRMYFAVSNVLVSNLNGDGDLVDRAMACLLMPESSLVAKGATRHLYQSIISRSAHRGQVDSFHIDCPDLDRQSVYDQPVDKRKVKKELSNTVGNWYERLLRFCTMMEDMVGPGVTVSEDKYGFWRVTLPSEISVIENGTVLVGGDRQIDLTLGTKLEAVRTANIAIETKSTTELLVTSTNIAASYSTGFQRGVRRTLLGNSLCISLDSDKEYGRIVIDVPHQVLRRSVDSRRIDDMLSHGNRLFGLREITSTGSQSRKLAVAATLLGMGGLSRMGSSKDDPREIVFNHGELTGFRGRLLYLRNVIDATKIKLHPIAHDDWHARFCAYDSDDTECAEILIAVGND